MNTPVGKKVNVLFLGFNRPALTYKVLQSIAEYAPEHLYVALDGARPGSLSDAEGSAAIKEMIEKWSAANPAVTIHRLYRESNLGCGIAVSQAITWFFEQEEMGIILEDDCLPNKSFFGFCEELLHRYRNEEKIMHIGGSNYLYGHVPVDTSYYFSRLPQIWGWATWKRAWDLYDFRMSAFDQLLTNPVFQRYFKFERDIYTLTKEGRLDTWDVQWVYTIYTHGGLSIVSTGNLVTNAGFDDNKGVHLIKKPKWYNDQTVEITTMRHPDRLEPNTAADDYVTRRKHRIGIQGKLKKLIKKLLFIRH